MLIVTTTLFLPYDNHSVLIKKLDECDVSVDLLRWLKSYISNKSQIVMWNWFRFTVSRVPPNSLLTHLLFTIYIIMTFIIEKFKISYVERSWLCIPILLRQWAFPQGAIQMHIKMYLAEIIKSILIKIDIRVFKVEMCSWINYLHSLCNLHGHRLVV